VLSRAVAPHLFSGQGPLAESSVTFGARVHFSFRTPKPAQQLASWSLKVVGSEPGQHNHALAVSPSFYLQM
jgi:hypothetical protein